MSETQCMLSGLVIACDVNKDIITRLTRTRSRNMASTMKPARSVLQLKEGLIRIDIHINDGPTSTYPGKPMGHYQFV